MHQDGGPLRVLQLTRSSAYAGLSRSLHDLCAGLVRRGHRVTVAGARGPWHDLFEGSGVRWVEVPLDGGLLDLFRSYRTLRRGARAEGLDVVHAHYRRSMLVARGLAVRLGVPCVSTRHSTDVPPSGLRRRLTDFGDHVIAPSEGARRWLIERWSVRPERVSVIAHGVDLERFAPASEADRLAARAALGIAPDAPVGAYVGRIGPDKQPDWLVDLAAASAADLPDLVILLMGRGTLEEPLRRRVRDEGLEKRVVILPYGDPLPVYRAADLVLLPSQSEGFGLTTVEGMAVGRAFLRTDTAGAAEQLAGGAAGRAVPVDRGAFIAAARRMLADREALRRMGIAAAEHARQSFSLDRQVDETIALYRRLIASR